MGTSHDATAPTDEGESADDGGHVTEPDEGGGESCIEMAIGFKQRLDELPNLIEDFAICEDYNDCAVMNPTLACLDEEGKPEGILDQCPMIMSTAKVEAFMRAIEDMKPDSCPACFHTPKCTQPNLGCNPNNGLCEFSQ